MPKLIDYAARFDLMREAAFEITKRDGPHAITLDAVATELQMSVSALRRALRSAHDLPFLGFQWAEKRQRRHLFERLAGEVRTSDALRRVVNALLRFLPSTDEIAEELRVWGLLVDDRLHDSDWARDAREGRNHAVDELAAQLVSLLDLSAEEAAYELARLRAVFEGATLLICAGRLDAEAGAAMIQRHLGELVDEDSRTDAA